MFVALLLLLCVFLSSCISVSADDEAYKIGDSITLTDNKTGNTFAEFSVYDVSLLDEEEDIPEIESDFELIAISYKVEFEGEGRDINRENFKVTDSNGKEALFVRQSGIVGEDLIDQTLVYAVSDAGSHIDIAFSLNKDSKADIIYRAKRYEYSLDVDYNKAVDDLLDSKAFAFLNGGVFNSIVIGFSVLVLGVAMIALIINEVLVRRHNKKTASSSLAAVPDVIEAQPFPKKKKQKKKKFFGVCSLLWVFVPCLIAGLVVLLIAMFSSPSNFFLAFLLFPFLTLAGFIFLPCVHVLSSAFGIVCASIAFCRGESRGLAYTAVILNTFCYMFALIMSFLTAL